MRRILDWLYDAAGVLAAIALFAIFAVMIGAAVLRTLGRPTGGTDDIVSWLTAAAAFLAMAHSFRHGDFVRVLLVIDSLSPARRRVVELVCLAIGAVFVGYLAVGAVNFVWESYEINDIANGLIPMPLWIPQFPFALGAVLLLVALVDELVTVIRGGTPSYVRAVEERHARGDYTEDI